MLKPLTILILLAWQKRENCDLEQDQATADIDQDLSKEQTRGIRYFMDWKHIPDVDTATSDADDNHFAGPKQQLVGKISVNLPDDWLCKKLDKLNLTLVEGYPSRSSEAGGLQRDQYVRTAKSQSKWYELHPNKDKGSGSVSFWYHKFAKLNNS